MKVYWITPQSVLPSSNRGGVLMLGNFDGFHKGHMLLVSKAFEISCQNKHITGQNNLPVSLLTFYPHPQTLFSPKKTCFFITSLRAKLRWADALNIDYVYLCKFTPHLADMSAKQFMEIFLSNMMNPSHIVVGEDFNFGKNKKGTPATLRLGGFNVTTVQRDAHYSSSRARAFIEAGDMLGALEILGRPYEIEGYVQKGYEEARTLGFPTVNIPIERFIRPAMGVYATQTYLNGQWQNSLSYFGRRKLDKEPILETHIFNYNGNLYHKRLRVRFMDFIRKPLKFKNVREVKHQVDRDARTAQIKLENLSPLL